MRILRILSTSALFEAVVSPCAASKVRLCCEGWRLDRHRGQPGKVLGARSGGTAPAGFGRQRQPPGAHWLRPGSEQLQALSAV